MIRKFFYLVLISIGTNSLHAAAATDSAPRVDGLRNYTISIVRSERLHLDLSPTESKSYGAQVGWDIVKGTEKIIAIAPKDSSDTQEKLTAANWEEIISQAVEFHRAGDHQPNLTLLFHCPINEGQFHRVLDTLRRLEYTNHVTKLMFSYPEFAALPHRCFDGFSQLRSLCIGSMGILDPSEASLVYVSPTAFADLHCLEVLSINSNPKLKSISDGAFDDLRKLGHLSLYMSPALEKIPMKAGLLPSLDSLKLLGSRIGHPAHTDEEIADAYRSGRFGEFFTRPERESRATS